MKYSLRLSLFAAFSLLLGASTLIAQPEHDHHKCGTFLSMDIASRKDQLNEKERQLLRQLQTTQREDRQRSIVSRNGHFRIHYDTTGFHAVSRVDGNANGIPDYIDSVDYYMEYAWEVEINELGYITPPPDNPSPGSGGIDGRIDVYINEVNGYYYGRAFPEISLPGNRFTGYIELDNNFEEFPTSGIDGLRITAAHEFHHVVQFAGYRYDRSQAALYEATSTWMEYRVHPDVNDYRYYFNLLLKQPQHYGFSTHNTSDTATGYAHMHYLQLLVRQLKSSDIVRSIWEEFKSNGSSFDAINNALLKTSSGLNLSNSYCTFAHWSYYTGTHARTADTPFFAKAELYPDMVPAQIRSMPAESETGFVGSLMPLSFGLWRLILPRDGAFAPDTVDFLVTNARSDIHQGGLRWLHNPEIFSLDVRTTSKEDYLPIDYGKSKLYYKLDAPHANFCVEVIVNGSPGVVPIAHPTPQPFYNDGADKMVFAVNLGAETMVTKIHIDIYSASMTRVAIIDRTELEQLENLQGIVWDGRDVWGEPVPSGIYIYTLSINDGEPGVGKFAVVKR